MIIVIKLISGVEVIGTVIQEDDELMQLEKPMVMGTVERNGASYYTMAPYSYVSDVITFTKRFVVQVAVPYDEIGFMYEKALKKPERTEDPSDALYESGAEGTDSEEKSEPVGLKKTLH